MEKMDAVRRVLQLKRSICHPTIVIMRAQAKRGFGSERGWCIQPAVGHFVELDGGLGRHARTVVGTKNHPPPHLEHLFIR
jgi:hypothetical protein